MPTINEVAVEVIHCDKPCPVDGVSNIERFSIILEEFEVNSIDMVAPFPYGRMLMCSDPDRVGAAVHLAKLQHAFSQGLHARGMLDDREAMLQDAWFTLNIMRLEWHLQHLNKDEPTPAFTFIN